MVVKSMINSKDEGTSVKKNLLREDKSSVVKIDIKINVEGG